MGIKLTTDITPPLFCMQFEPTNICSAVALEMLPQKPAIESGLVSRIQY